MPELLTALPPFHGKVLLICLFAIFFLYIFALIMQNARDKKTAEEYERVVREELSMGAEGLIFHIPFNQINQEKKEDCAHTRPTSRDSRNNPRDHTTLARHIGSPAKKNSN